MSITRLVTLPPVTIARTTAPLPEVIVISGVLGKTSWVSTIILSTTWPVKTALALLGTWSINTKGGVTYPLPLVLTLISSNLPKRILSWSLKP